MPAYLSAVRRYFDFAGRSSRSDFWLFTLTLMIIMLIALVIDSAIESLGVLAALVYAVHVIPSVSITVRRLHDINRSGWWVWIGLVPLVGPIVLLVFACTAATDAPNRFGLREGPFASSATVPVAVVSSAGTSLDHLEKLAALRSSGAIDDGEFQRLKNDLLGKASS
ncbi:hypothetical protein GCM10007920_23980 [Ciceribacter naphthalenivorans]|uniref:SHOCT domain-containing protein n=3 Tax=Pseudomonadota TaxID=1224 RepID=A0A512HQ33_9HYPH|nr:hypothetical protein RNA01_44710 [Ciceribacter naphthalenivorans]GLR22611.1 hypothetical protein GCM10007920_23980 [Ciceribacter naphthalenivorans]GLT05467.1 hypothetical protein GCM10007926_23980 [Sphingomonas psychrolutea]